MMTLYKKISVNTAIATVDMMNMFEDRNSRNRGGVAFSVLLPLRKSLRLFVDHICESGSRFIETAVTRGEREGDSHVSFSL